MTDVPLSDVRFIDRYEVVGRIASGGMATVHLARLSGAGGFQRLFAIKQLHQHLADNKEFVDMFLDEARLAASIHHPNVVPILEVGTGERGYYLVMEYIEGGTLVSLIGAATAKQQTLSIPVVVRIMLDLLAGLHEAHELNDGDGNPAGLVHRDVSPHNVLLGVDGITRITDFGVARAAARLSGTRVGQLKGKIAYMAPEQVIGDVEVDRRADVFAAAIVMWEALSLRRLFKGQNEASTLSAVLHKPLITPRRDLDGAVEAVCMKALARNRDDRYATCAEFAEALETAAVATHGVASTKDVAKLVKELLGDLIGEARASVRSYSASRPRAESFSGTGSGSGSLAGSGSGPASGSGSGSIPRSGSTPGAEAASPASTTLTVAVVPSSGNTLPSAEASASGVVVVPSEPPRRRRTLVVGGLAAAAVISVGVWFALPSVVARPSPDASAVAPKPSIDSKEAVTATATQAAAPHTAEAPPASTPTGTTETKKGHRVTPGPFGIAPPKATASAAAPAPATTPTAPATSKGRVFREDL